MGEFRLTKRVGPKVRRERFGSLDDALAGLEREIEGVGRAPGRSVFGRDYDPVQQVAGRFELKGPGGMCGGIDVRGDGSAEAYTGRLRKRLVERRPGEDAVQALKRELTT